MNVIYNLANGKKLSVFLWGDVYEGKDYRKYIEVSEIVDGKTSEEKKEVFLKKDSIGRLYFNYDCEIIFIDDFEYMTVNQLIAKLHSNEYVSEDMVLATFLKDTDQVGIIDELPQFDVIIPEMGIGLYSSSGKTSYVLCEPIEHHYKKHEWHYKIGFTSVDKSLQQTHASKDYYFSDFFSHLKRGIITLVNKQEYQRDNQQKQHQKK